MKQEDLEATLESALQALVSTRCARAYRHEVRNGLQGVYGGVDALIRCARPKGTSPVPLDKTIEFVREAVARHETGLDRMVEHLAPGDEAPSELPATKMLGDLASFLSSDAARHAVKFRMDVGEQIVVRARPARMRLVFLGLMTDAIDAVSGGGELRLATRTHAGSGIVEISDTRAGVLSGDPWALDLSAQPLTKGILLPVTRSIIAAQDGRVECSTDSNGTGRVIRITLPLAH